MEFLGSPSPAGGERPTIAGGETGLGSVRFELRDGTHVYVLPRGLCTVGRSPQCDITIADATISRKHAAFLVTERDICLHDMGSRHELLLNGQPIDGSHPLIDGDRIVLGKHELVLHIDDAPAVTALTSSAPPPVFDDGDTASSAGVNPLAALLDTCAQALRDKDYARAERSLQTVVSGLDTQPGSIDRREGFLLARTVAQCLQLAGTTRKWLWIDQILGLHCQRRMLLGDAIATTLRGLAAELRYPGGAQLRQYRELVDAHPPSAERRFADQQLKRLERVVAVQGDATHD